MTTSPRLTTASPRPSRPRPSRLSTLAGYYGFVLIGGNGVLIPSMIRAIEHDFRQTDTAVGLLYFFGALVYACGAFSGGFLTERLGRRAVLTAAALSFALGLAGEGLAPAWPLLFLAAVPVNWGGGAIDGGVNGLFLDLYRDARGGALNLLHLFFGLGALIVPFVVGQVLTAGVSWRLIALGAAACALPLCGVLARSALPSGRTDHGAAEARGELVGAERSLLPFAGLALGIGFYVAAELAVSNWVVKLLVAAPVATATGILSVFWAGLSLGRLLSNWLAERVDYYGFTLGCIVLASLSLLGAVLAPSLVVAGALFGLTGMFFGPIYPMIMALGGNIYPRRLAALSGGLAASAVAGAIVYPPLMGLLAAHIGLRAGMIGAALLGIPMALGLLGARTTSRRLSAVSHQLSAISRQPSAADDEGHRQLATPVLAEPRAHRGDGAEPDERRHAKAAGDEPAADG